jgi:predicted DNA-binding transcriptional regulator AlpA
MSRLATLAADPERVDSVPPAELPALLGELEALRARLWSRVAATPAPPAPNSPPANGTGTDTLVTAQEAADRLGVSRRWGYRKADSPPFAKRIGPNTLRFIERGLERWQARQ